MRSDSGRRWLIAAVGLFLLLLVGWVVLALQLNVALAGPLPFAPRLMSNLQADYAPDGGNAPIGLISLSIMDEALQSLGDALGLSDEEEAALHESMELAMSQPVPTATALDFEGSVPFTATPTKIPPATDTPTPLPTSTRPPATRTPTKEPTRTKEPTDKPGPTDEPEPTSAATGPATAEPTDDADVADPEILSVALNPSPPSNEGSCEIEVLAVVFDPAPSSGIDDVYARMQINDGSWDNTSLSLSSGGFEAGAWYGHYTGTVSLSGASEGDTVTIKIKVKDNSPGADWIYSGEFNFTMDSTCP